MSNPSRQQRRFPSRVPVCISRNVRRLPPLSETAHSTDHENESARSTAEHDDLSAKSIQIAHSTEHKALPNKPIQKVQSAELDDQLTKSSLSLTGIDIEHQTSSIDVNDFWTRLRQHIAKEPLKDPADRGCQQTLNKVVRIFVSSTFTDFFNEREILIKKVFPELRDELESVGLQVIDCDLRWGVPKDSTTEQTILACLEELDRCFEDNAQPFFIGLVSDKYGWVPNMTELPKNITERYRWMDGASITLMEFIHGAFRTHNPNAFFLIRNSENVLKNLPEKFIDKFRDKDELSQRQIQELKKQLPDIISPEHIFHYDCFYNGLDSTTGRERINIDGLEEFGAKTKDFLMEAIKKWYSANFNYEDSSNADQKQMTTFLLNKTQFFVDRPEEFSILLKYIAGAHHDFNLLPGMKKNAENHPSMMIIKGQAGDGKTMLLGKFVLHIEETMKDKFILFYHFLDGAFHPNASHYMYNALVQKLDKYLEENNILSPTTGQRLNTADETFLAQAIAILPVSLVIIIDGLDKGDIHQQRKYADEFPFSCYSQLESDHTYIIVSCEIRSLLNEEINAYSHYELKLKPLTIDQRSAYVEKFFTRFNKILEPEQKSLILNNKGSEHPLYLSYLCENLRQFGDYSLITKRLKTYPQTTDELLDVLLNEVNSTIGNQALVDAFFKALVGSNVGILESDIVTMLEHYMNINKDENDKTRVDRMIWSTVRRHLKLFLDTSWIDGHQLINFRHSTLQQKLRKRYFEENSKDLQTVHSFLANFCLKSSTMKDFSTRRVPYHYEQANMLKELLLFLRSQDSRPVNQLDRQVYLRKHRCTRIISEQDSVTSQRAYVCGTCATLFRLGPYTMTKSACLICTNLILGINMSQFNTSKREARLCNKHGAPGYPRTLKCAVCKIIRVNMTGTGPKSTDHVPLYICFQCWLVGGAGTRCCEFETD